MSQPSPGPPPNALLTEFLEALARRLAPLGWAALLCAAAEAGSDPPSRALSLELCASPRLAGTTGSAWGARVVARHLEEAGWEVELDRRVVLLSLPRRLELAAYGAPGEEHPEFRRIACFDPDAVPPGDVPLFNAWSASGRARGPVVDVGRGLREDYERLAAEGVDVRGRIAVARYGGSYRGVKARLAEEHGCAGLLLFSDPEQDGEGAGQVWPRGPFKPPWDAQRGSIYPISRAPGDPTTPGWGSPAPGAEPERERLSFEELAPQLPGIPCMPAGAREALAVLGDLNEYHGHPVQGPVEVELVVDQPAELRTIVNVIARLPGADGGIVVAGNHRDAWVRGAHDAGSGTVSLLRAAQRLGERARGGWRPRHTIVLGFWDAEETGLVGSTEWAEAHGELLRRRAYAYVNADALVSGLRLRADGTPGLLGAIRRAAERVPDPVQAGRSLADAWIAAAGDGGPRLGLPGSGSDYTAFLHHLGVPVLDLGLSGNAGGQYHAAFDDFPLMDRFLDPGWRGHETAGHLVAELLALLADEGPAAFDPAEAAAVMAGLARGEADWLGEERAERLAAAFERIAAAGPFPAAEGARFYQALEDPRGLEGRPWFRNRLWAPGLETGYASETLPGLRSAAARGEAELDRALEDLVRAVAALELRLSPPGQNP